MRILVVEDEPRVGTLARRVLEGEGCTVDVVESAGAALTALRDERHEYDVVIIDRVLPDASGDEIAGEVAALFPRSGVVLTSGRAATRRPFHDVWLAKPYWPADLVRAVSAALIARSLRLHGRPRDDPSAPSS